MSKGYLLVEGQGEVAAVLNLVTRLWADLGLGPATWGDPVRGRGLQNVAEIRSRIAVIRRLPGVGRLLILRDADNKRNESRDCPGVIGPSIAGVVASEKLPFRSAIVLFRMEYETLFLPCLPLMAGRPIVIPGAPAGHRLKAGTAYEGDYESIRGVKEWLRKRMEPGGTYRPGSHQLPMTRMLDFPTLRASGLPCFGTLERALKFLAGPPAGPGEVYPPPA